MNSWQANLTADSQSIEIVAILDGETYRKAIYDLESIVCRWWASGDYEYVGLYHQKLSSEALIIVDTDPQGNANNRILGLASPAAIQTAWGSIGGAGASTAATANASAVTAGIQASASISAIVDNLGAKSEPAYDGTSDRSLLSLVKGVFNKLLDAAQVTTTVDNSTRLAAIDSKLGAIVTNTSGNRYEFDLATDDVGTLIVRYDKQSGTVANFDLSLNAYSPVGNVRVASKDNTSVQAQEYQAKSSNFGNWSIDDRLIRIYVYNLSTGAVVGGFWHNDSTGAALSISPVLGVDVDEADAAELARLKLISEAIGSINAPSATDTASAWSLNSLLRLVAVKLTDLLSLFLGSGANIKPAAGAKFVGTIDQTTQGTTNFVTANQTQIGGAAVSTGNGLADPGTQRIAIASDGYPALPTGTNIIGLVGIDGANNNVELDPAQAALLTSIDGKLTSGNQKSIVRSGTKGTSSPADITSTPAGLNKEALDVAIIDAAGNQITTFGGDITTAAKGTTLAGSPTSTNVSADRQALDVDTELPTPITLTDAIANPTTPIVGAAEMGWTGTVWERLQSVAGSLKVALQSTTNNIGNVRITDLTNFLPTMDDPARRGYQQLTDGTNSPAIKGASTPAAGTDPALVVAISPNSGLASESTLNNILTQLQGDRSISSHLFVDSTGTVYLRALAYSQTANAYESVSLDIATGATYTPVPPETAVDRSDFDTTETVWEITTAGTGYSIGDVVSQFTLISQNPIAVAGVLWYNQSTSAAIAAPLVGHRRRVGSVGATEATLAAVNNKLQTGSQLLAQSVGVAAPQKTIVSLPASVPAANTDLLTGTVNGWFDARAFAAASIEVFWGSPLTGGGTIFFEKTNDPSIATGLQWVMENEGGGSGTISRVDALAGSPNTKVSFRSSVDTGWVRVRCLDTPIGGGTIRCVAAFSQIPLAKGGVGIMANSNLASVTTVTTVNNATLSGLAAINDTGGTINASATSPTFLVTSGTSLQFEVSVSSVSGTSPTLVVVVQESSDNLNWRSIYRFPTITAIGSYRSPVLPNNCRSIRYVQTVGGTAPSFTRNIWRHASNIGTATAVGSQRLGGFAGGATNIIDLPLHGRIRRLTANNRTAGLLFLQIHDKATVLTAGNVPLNGEVYPLVAGSSLPFTAADFGEVGSWFGENPRIGISSTFGTYTAAVIAANQASLFVEVV
jgi:hypothetical protein